MAIVTMTLARARNAIFAVLRRRVGWTPDTELVLEVMPYDDDDCCGERPRVRYYRVRLAELVDCAGHGEHGLLERWRDGTYRLDATRLMGLRSESAAVDWLGGLSEAEWHAIRLWTPADYAAEQERQEREACEAEAARLAAESGTKPGTLEFVAAVADAQQRLGWAREDHHSQERMAEDYAGYAAAGSDAFWSDRDFAAGLLDRRDEAIERVWRYLETHCPLLVCQWREQQLAATGT